MGDIWGKQDPDARGQAELQYAAEPTLVHLDPVSPWETAAATIRQEQHQNQDMIGSTMEWIGHVTGTFTASVRRYKLGEESSCCRCGRLWL